MTRVYPGIVSNDLIDVQPMSPPSGNVFYLKYKYNKSLQQIEDIQKRWDIRKKKRKMLKLKEILK